MAIGGALDNSAAPYGEHPEPLRARDALTIPALVRQPDRERVSAEVPGYDHPGGAPGTEPREPGVQELVQRLLPDPDGRVRPDLVVEFVGPYVLGQGRRDPLADAELVGVGACQREGALVDVDRCDPGVGVRKPERDRERPDPAAEVEEPYRAFGRVAGAQQHRRTDIQAPTREDAARGLELDVGVPEPHRDTERLGLPAGSLEVVAHGQSSGRLRVVRASAARMARSASFG